MKEYRPINNNGKKIKELLLLILSLVLISLIQSALSFEGKVSQYTAYVNAPQLNVRSGPGTSYSVMGKLNKNQSVKVTHHNGIWRQIAWIAGKPGFVSGNYLKLSQNADFVTGSDPEGLNTQRTSNPSSAPNSSSPSSTRLPSSNDSNVSDYSAVVTASALNVRSGPGTQHGIIGKRQQKATVRVTHHNGVWRRIEWAGGAFAYVHGNYLIKQQIYPISTEENTNFDTGMDPEGLDTKSSSQQVELTSIQELEEENPGAAEKYIECMIGKFTSKTGAALKAKTLFRNGVRLGLKKIATSPMIAVNHLYCAAQTHDWSAPKPYSTQSQSCTPAMGILTGCKELNQFYGTEEGIKIWNSFQFTSACDPECRLSCYYHGKNKRTLEAFISDPATVEPLRCRYQ